MPYYFKNNQQFSTFVPLKLSPNLSLSCNSQVFVLFCLQKLVYTCCLYFLTYHLLSSPLQLTCIPFMIKKKNTLLSKFKITFKLPSSLDIYQSILNCRSAACDFAEHFLLHKTVFSWILGQHSSFFLLSLPTSLTSS